MQKIAGLGGFIVVLSSFAAAHAGEGNSTERVACPYPTAHDAPLDAVSDLIDEAETFRKFRVEFNGVKADRVPALLYVPTNRPPPYPAVLLQYGIGGNKSVDYIVSLGKQFVARGFAVLTIDVPGRGERKVPQASKRFLAEWMFNSEGRELFLQFCGDYSRAVDYLAARPDVDRNRICFVGISWGAITGVTYAAHDPRIKVVGSMVGGGGFLGANSTAIPVDDKPKAQNVPIDPIRHIGMISPRPVLLLNVTKDQLVLRPFAEALHNSAGESAKKVWLETDHYFNGIDRHGVGEMVIDFIDESLNVER